MRITSQVANYSVGSKTYYPGDIVAVPESHFDPYFMEKVEEPKVEAIEVKDELIAISEPSTEEPVQLEEKKLEEVAIPEPSPPVDEVKPKPRKRKTT